MIHLVTSSFNVSFHQEALEGGIKVTLKGKTSLTH